MATPICYDSRAALSECGYVSVTNDHTNALRRSSLDSPFVAAFDSKELDVMLTTAFAMRGFSVSIDIIFRLLLLTAPA